MKHSKQSKHTFSYTTKSSNNTQKITLEQFKQKLHLFYTIIKQSQPYGLYNYNDTFKLKSITEIDILALLDYTPPTLLQHKALSVYDHYYNFLDSQKQLVQMWKSLYNKNISEYNYLNTYTTQQLPYIINIFEHIGQFLIKALGSNDVKKHSICNTSTKFSDKYTFQIANIIYIFTKAKQLLVDLWEFEQENNKIKDNTNTSKNTKTTYKPIQIKLPHLKIALNSLKNINDKLHYQIYTVIEDIKRNMDDNRDKLKTLSILLTESVIELLQPIIKIFI